MSNTHFSLALLAPLLMTMASVPKANSSMTLALAPFKCRNATLAKPLFYVDGHLISADSSAKISKERLGYVSVTCLNAVDSTVLSPLSRLPGIPIISVWTEAGPFARVQPAVTAIIEAQNALHLKSGSFRRDVTTQPLSALPSDMKVTFESTETGWDATVRIDHPLSPRCHVFGGDSATGGIDALTKKPVPAGKIVCADG